MTGPSLSDGAQRALVRAREEAARLGHDVVGAELLLAGLFLSSDTAAGASAALGLPAAELAERLAGGQKKVRARGEAPLEADIPLSSHARRLLEQAQREATERGAALGDEHLLVAALGDPRGTLARVLSERGISRDRAREAAATATGLLLLPPREPAEPTPAAAAPETDPAAAEAARAEREALRQAREAERKARREAQKQREEEKRKAREARQAAAPVEPRSSGRTEAESPARRREESGRGRERGERRGGERGGEAVGAAAPPPRAPSVGKLAPKPKPKPKLALWRWILLLAVPVAVWANLTHQAPVLTFVVACIAVLPLAGFMGEATEQLAERTGPTIGGLLNATFGNAAELIIAIVALRAGLVELVKASITGSILGNLLLILGLSLVAGGLGRSETRFNRTATGMSATMLTIAVVSLTLPALFHATHSGERVAAQELWMSEGVSIVLLLVYGCSLLFSLRTHKRLFGGEPHPTTGAHWSVPLAVAVLAVATGGVAYISEVLVHATEALTREAGVSEFFLGLIVIPIIGNAAEHAAAVVVARKGQMDLALQIALGSSTQIALLVAPVLVFAGVAFGQPMNLVFTPFEVIGLGLATLIATFVTQDGESHWFEGLQLLAVYAILGIAAFFV